MAIKKPKTPKKHRPRPRLRNAATAAATPRSGPAEPPCRPPTDWGDRAWQVAKLGGGMLAGAVVCAYVAKNDWLPPKVITGATATLGGALLVGGESDTLRWLGAGAAAAAGGQLLLMAVDDQMQSKAPEKVASTTPPPKRPANADGLPPGALEAAYERARRRLEMTQAGDVAA